MSEYAGDRTKALSQRAAQRCEDAAEPICKCRCGGALHGSKRGNVRELPVTDPHSPARKCKSCKGLGVWKYSPTSSQSFPCDSCKGTGSVLPKEKK